MSKAPFIHPEWTSILERAARSVGLAESLEVQFRIMEKTLMASFDDLKREVSDTRSVIQGAVTLIGGLSEKLKEAVASAAAAGVPVDYAPLIAELDDAQAELANAVAANTPAAPFEQPLPVIEAPVAYPGPMPDPVVADAPPVSDAPVEPNAEPTQ